MVAYPSFRLSPRPFWFWRRLLLRLFGAKIGAGVHVFPSVKITIPWNLNIGSYSAIGDRAILYALGPIKIGENVTISQFAHLCAGSHDYNDPSMELLKLPIVIENEAWVCADAFIGPNVVVGAGAVVGARATVVKNVRENAIVVGNPAQQVSKRKIR